MPENTREILELIAKKFDLPLVALIGNKETEECYRMFLKSFSGCCIAEYVLAEMHLDTPEIVFKNNTEQLEEYFRETTNLTDQEIEERINSLPWRKVILANFDELEE